MTAITGYATGLLISKFFLYPRFTFLNNAKGASRKSRWHNCLYLGWQNGTQWRGDTFSNSRWLIYVESPWLSNNRPSPSYLGSLIGLIRQITDGGNEGENFNYPHGNYNNNNNNE